MIERSIAILRREVREGRLGVIREEDRVQRYERNERRERLSGGKKVEQL